MRRKPTIPCLCVGVNSYSPSPSQKSHSWYLLNFRTTKPSVSRDAPSYAAEADLLRSDEPGAPTKTHMSILKPF